MSDATPYRRAQRRARRAAGSLRDDAVRRIVRSLRTYATSLSGELSQLSAATPASRRAALQASFRITRETSDALEIAIRQAVSQHRRLSFLEVRDIWRQAGQSAARASGVRAALLGAVKTPPITLMGAYENLGGGARTWKTALTQYARNGARDVDAIVRAGIQSGVSMQELARRLRPYVQGAEEFHKAFGGEAFAKMRDLRGSLTTPELKEAARRMQYNARRIAESEILNARAEAELEHYAADPLIDGIIWTVSPDRGTTRTPDVCQIAGTLITTAAGLRRIEDVAVGDLVLTHEGRFRPTIRLYRRTIPDGRLVRLHCQAAQNRMLHLVMTPNHPVLTDRGWVSAGDLRTGSRVALSPEGPLALADRSCCGNECKEEPGFAGSAPFWGPGIGVSEQYGEAGQAEHRILHTHIPASFEPTLQRIVGSDTPQCLRSLHATVDCFLEVAWQTSLCASFQASSTFPSGYSQLEYKSNSPVRQYVEIIEIEELCSPGETVFNLGNDDHSYVANGIVVHNCDALATARFYTDRPKGWYPLHAVPLPPHPHDRCSRVPSVRDVRDAGKLKPTPSRMVSIAQVNLPPGLKDRRAVAMRGEMARLFANTDRHDVQGGVRALMSASTAPGSELAARVPRGARTQPEPPRPKPPAPTVLNPALPNYLTQSPAYLAETRYASLDELGRASQSFVGPESQIRRFVFDSPEPERESAVALFDPDTKDIHINPETTQQLRAFLAGDRGPIAADGLQTLFHEVLHSASPMLVRPDWRTQFANFASFILEEGTVEYRARLLAVRTLLRTTATYEDIPQSVRAVFNSRPQEVRAIWWLEKHGTAEAVERMWRYSTAAERIKAAGQIVAGHLKPALRAAGVAENDLAGILDGVMVNLADFLLFFPVLDSGSGLRGQGLVSFLRSLGIRVP